MAGLPRGRRLTSAGPLAPDGMPGPRFRPRIWGHGLIRRLRYQVRVMSAYRRHAALTSLTSIGLYSAGLVTGPIIARALGPSGRGDIAAVVAPATIVVLLVSFGLPTAAAYFVDTFKEEQLLLTATAFGIAVGAPLCAVLWFLAPGYLEGHSAETLTWARIILLNIPLSVGMSAALEVRRRTKPGLSWNVWRSMPLLVPAAATVLLAIAGRLTLTSVLAAYAVGSVIPLALLASRLRGRRPWPRPSMGTLRVMLPYAWRTASLGTAMSLTNRLDQVVLVGIVSPAELGLYAVAVMVASVTHPVTSGLSSALFGHLMEERSTTRAHARFRSSLITIILVSSTVALVIGVLAPILLRVAFGSLFAPASTTLRLLLPGAVAFDVLGVIITKLLSEGRPGQASSAAFLGTAVTVLGLAILAPRYGIEGAAAVTSIAWITQVAYLVQRGAIHSRPATRVVGGPRGSVSPPGGDL